MIKDRSVKCNLVKYIFTLVEIIYFVPYNIIFLYEDIFLSHLDYNDSNNFQREK